MMRNLLRTHWEDSRDQSTRVVIWWHCVTRNNGRLPQTRRRERQRAPKCLTASREPTTDTRSNPMDPPSTTRKSKGYCTTVWDVEILWNLLKNGPPRMFIVILATDCISRTASYIVCIVTRPHTPAIQLFNSLRTRTVRYRRSPWLLCSAGS